MSVRPTHLEHAKAGHQRGWIGELHRFRLSATSSPALPAVSAGATFEGEQSGGKMTGSWFLIKEESLDAARARLSKDIYSTGGAWDMDAVSRFRRGGGSPRGQGIAPLPRPLLYLFADLGLCRPPSLP